MRSPSFPLSARGILRKGLLNLALAFMAGLLRPATAATIVEYPIPTNGSLPGGITPGPDGNLWFTEGIGNKIGRITPSGQITEFALSSPDSGPSDITTGPDGALWFTEGNN